MEHIFSSFKEALSSVMPIALIVLALSSTCIPLDAGVLVMFILGTIMLIMGMGFFTIGSGISMEPLGRLPGNPLWSSAAFSYQYFLLRFSFVSHLFSLYARGGSTYRHQQKSPFRDF